MSWGSLALALLVARLRLAAPTGDIPTGSLVRGVLLGALIGSAVWAYGRCELLAAAVWRVVLRRRTI